MCLRDTAPYGSEVLPDVVFQLSKMCTPANDKILYYCTMINIISEQIPLTQLFYYGMTFLLLCWEKKFFSLQSPADLGRVQRKKIL